MQLKKKLMIPALLVAGVFSALPALAEANFPNKAVKLIVPYPPGGASDILARLFGQKLQEKWKQSVIIENKPGASGTIGADNLIKSPADGYTLLLVNNTHTINGHIYPKLPYNTVKDFSTITTFARVPFIMVGSKNFSAKNLSEIITLAKSKPGSVNLGIVANAGLGRISSEYFTEITGTAIEKIPFTGTAQLTAAVLGNQVDLALDTANAYSELAKTDNINPIAVSSEKRPEFLPNVKTFKEENLANFDVHMWLGIVTKQGVPQPIIDMIAKDIAEISKDEEVIKALVDRGMSSFVLGPKEFSEHLNQESDKYLKIILSRNISAK